MNQTHRLHPNAARVARTAETLVRAFPTLAPLPDLFDPARLGPSETDLVRANDLDIHTGRVFWHLTQNMLMRDAVDLYFALARYKPDSTIKTKAHMVGLWVRGAYIAELGQAVRRRLEETTTP